MYSQVEIFPEHTMTATANGPGDGPLGRSGGVTYTFTSTEDQFANCTLLGFMLGEDAAVNMNNLIAPPTASCSYNPSDYFSYSSGENTNSLTLSGVTQVFASNPSHTSTGLYNVPTNANISSPDVIFKRSGDFIYVDVSGLSNFTLTVEYVGIGPAAGYISTNYTGVTIPVVSLYDALSNSSSRSICTTFASRFYAFESGGTSFAINSLDAGTNSLRDMIVNGCPGDTIRFDEALQGDTIKLESELAVNRNIVIDGGILGGKMVVSGQHANRIFDFAEDVSVTLINIELIRGFDAATGGAFVVPQDCTLNNVIFKENNMTSNKEHITLNAMSNLTIKNVVGLYP
ncbi:hypothetical protein GCM10007940_21940 [Portibacter lacus]|uniref:Uncharacterized protein n=1 Tax=Portibacter lacus TaxID=1099794 RepID=A0AA37WFE3_9BACT|nr:hypothetical protein GCM10007940_21940 [Portibacter lacus]